MFSVYGDYEGFVLPVYLLGDHVVLPGLMMLHALSTVTLLD